MITIYEDTIDTVTLSEIVKFAADCGIDEDFDTGCDLIYVWREMNVIVACLAFKKTEFGEGRIVPRWEHIIFDRFHTSHRKAHSSYRFLLQVLNDIRRRGYAQLWCYILPSKERMKNLALKLGFQKYAEDAEGDFLALQLITKGA
jgi:hypothetical protein